MARAVPRRGGRREIRRPRDGRRLVAPGLRRRRRLPPLRRPPAGRGPRRRPADHRPPRPARHPVGVPRRAAGHHARGHGGGADGAGRPGQPRGRGRGERSTARSRVGLSGEDAGLLHRRTPYRGRGRRAGRPRFGRRRRRGRSRCGAQPARRRADPGRRDGRPRPRRRALQRQRRHRRGGAGGGAARAEARRPHRRRGPLRRLAGHRRDHQRHPGEASSPTCCRPCLRGWCPRWRPACARSKAACPQAHVLDGRVPHALLLEVFTDEGVGTMVLPDEETAI